MKQSVPYCRLTVPNSVFIHPIQVNPVPSDQVSPPLQVLFSQLPPLVRVRPAEGLCSFGTEMWIRRRFHLLLRNALK